MKPSISWLDLKLGVRMMAKYPGMTLVGIVALTLAIGLSAAWFEFTREMFNPTLPLDEGHRVVAIRNWDVEKAAAERRTLHDFETWRTELRSVEDLGAASSLEHTLTTADRRTLSVDGAQMTASGFRLTRVAPLLGRPLLEEDERPGAPPVVVIGYGVWQRLFDGDPGAIGETVRIGSTTSTVVGVMPSQFAFPLDQEVWTPFRANGLEHERREGPAILVFGRLADGFSLEESQAELTALGLRAASEHPETNAQLRPRVDGYVDSFIGGGALAQSAVNIPFLLLLTLICGNVATLVFARTATRASELVTRSALGASRGRLVVQLFGEALVLTTVAAAAGLALAGRGTAWGMRLFFEVQGSRPPFWFDPSLSPTTILYTSALAVVSAALVGAVPAFKVTGRNLRAGLSQGSGGSGMRFGRISTGVIVVQVALCVILLPLAVVRAHDALGGRLESIGFPAEQFLSGALTRQSEVPLSAMSDAERGEFLARTGELHDQARRSLVGETGVTAVAFASRLPGMNHPYELLRIEAEAAAPDSVVDRWARTLSVDLAFFEVMDAPILAGRGFTPADLESEIPVAIVDATFVREYLAGRSPVGQRLHYPGPSEGDEERWYEIVGVVEDLAMNAYGPGGYQDLVQTGPAGYLGVYHPLRPGEHASVQMFIRTTSPDPDALAPPIQSTLAGLDPSLSAAGLLPLDKVWQPVHRSEWLITAIMTFVVALVMGLSAAGIYALMSFTVSQRVREIGIRTALGAGPERIVFTIFSRALAQIGLGVLIGGLLFTFVTGTQTLQGLALLGAVGTAMFGVGLLACILPATRALRIEPTEALRGD